MAKRFTDTNIWDQDWFLDMPAEYKLFWNYIKDKCDHAGIFKVNLRTFCALNEVKISPEKALNYFNSGKDRIRVLDNGRWFIEDFYFFQYGSTLNRANRLHESIYKLLSSNEVNLRSIRGLTDLKEGVKDKDKDKVKDKERINKEKRREKFIDQVQATEFTGTYGNEMLDSFCDYWLEENKSSTKFRFELQPTWDLSKRLARWNSNNFNKSVSENGRTSEEYIKRHDK